MKSISMGQKVFRVFMSVVFVMGMSAFPNIAYAAPTVEDEGVPTEVTDDQSGGDVGDVVDDAVAGDVGSAEEPQAYTLSSGGDDGGYSLMADEVVEVNGVGYATLAEAIAAAGAGDTVKLLDDVTVDSYVEIEKSLTIDLAGNTLSRNGNALLNPMGEGVTLTVEDSVGGGKISSKYPVYVEGGASFTLESGILESGVDGGSAIYAVGSGTITINGGTLTSTGVSAFTIAVFDTCSLVVNNGTVNAAGADSVAIADNGNAGNAVTMTINGGTITSQSDIAIYKPGAGTLTLNGGTITGGTGVYVKSGKLVVPEDSTVKVTANGDKAAYEHSGNGALSTGEAIVIENCNYPGGAPEAEIAGGTFTSENNAAVTSIAYDAPASDAVESPVTGFVSGGTLNGAEATSADCLEAGLVIDESGKVEAGELVVEGDIPAKDYNGKKQSPNLTGLTVTFGGVTLGADEYTVTWDDDSFINAGCYTATITYGAATAEVEYWIDMLSIGDMRVSIKDQTFTGAPITPAGSDIQFKDKRGRDIEGVQYTVTNVSNNINAGTAAISFTGAGNNFIGSANANFNIDPANMEDVEVALSAESCYKDSVALPTVTATFGDYSLAEGTDFSVTYEGANTGYTGTNPTDPDTYTVKLTGNGNFTGTNASKTFTISERFTVTFDSGNGEEIFSQSIDKGETATEPATDPVRDGYTFGGWYAEGATEAFDFTTPITSDVALTAKWTALPAIQFYNSWNIPAAYYFADDDPVPVGTTKGTVPTIKRKGDSSYHAVEDWVHVSWAVTDVSATTYEGASTTIASIDEDGVITFTEPGKVKVWLIMAEDNGNPVKASSQTVSYMVAPAYVVSADGTKTACSSLYAAFNAAQDGETVVLGKDAAVGNIGKMTLKDGRNITVDLNGYNIAFSSNYSATSFGALFTVNKGTLTVINSGDEGGITVAGTNARAFNVDGRGNASAADAVLTIGEGVDVAVAKDAAVTIFGNATLNTAGNLSAAGSFAIAGNGNADSAGTIINVSGGTVTGDEAGIYHPQSGTLNITGGEITGKTAVYQKSGTLNIPADSTAVLSATGAKADYTFNGNGANATGDAVVIDSCGYPGGAPVANISGGTFTSENAKGVASYVGNGVTELPSVKATSDSITVPDFEMWVANESGGYKLVEAVPSRSTPTAAPRSSRRRSRRAARPSGPPTRRRPAPCSRAGSSPMQTRCSTSITRSRVISR
jgi:uncharacterized repeat protein (TIGR02543 family)